VISVIGRSVALREDIAWFENRPLFGVRIVVTRATAIPGTLSSLLRAKGADVIEAPSTEIEALDSAAIDAAVQDIGTYDWLVLTSVTGVRFFGEALTRAGLDARALFGLNIAVIGPSTARALRDIGLSADLVPERFVAESLLEAMAAAGVGGERVLIATADDARALLPDGLRALGAEVHVVEMYRSRLITSGPDVEGLRAAIDDGEIAAVTFTSASTVSGFVAQVGEERARKVRAISIGPVTSDAARAGGLNVVAEGGEATMPGLVAAVIAAVGKKPRQ
jgi:uroporphyrinogen III methyltransferase/synthase